MKEKKKFDVPTITIIVLIIAMIFGFWFWGFRESKIYNDGVCLDCGGEYEFINASYDRGLTFYFYSCPDCGKTVKIHDFLGIKQY